MLAVARLNSAITSAGLRVRSLRKPPAIDAGIAAAATARPELESPAELNSPTLPKNGTM